MRWLSEFFESGYDIRSLMISIFTSSWFYDQKNIGTQIKSPVVLDGGHAPAAANGN